MSCLVFELHQISGDWPDAIAWVALELPKLGW